jgi:hypothetical protein
VAYYRATKRTKSDRSTVEITCPMCGKVQKTTCQSEWCSCDANAIWYRDDKWANKDLSELLKEHVPARLSWDDSGTGTWRYCLDAVTA